MTTFASHRATVEAFVDCMHRGADEDELRRLLAEDVALYGPLSDEPLTGAGAAVAAIRDVSTVATSLTYDEVLTGTTHHSALFRLQVSDTVVNGADRFLLDAAGRIVEIAIWWRPLPAGVEMQAHLAPLLGARPWELRTENSF